jgi:MerR family regulatory protein
MNDGRVEAASLSIGKVARRAGVGVETIRFYERQGLLTAPMRKESGYRLYSELVLGRIRFIRRAKEAWIFAKGNQGTPASQEKLFCTLRGCLRKSPSEDREH